MRSERDDEEDSLYMQTLGEFSVTWHGTRIIGGGKSRESQMLYLMQLLLHNRENGVSKGQLEEVLFGERDIQDIPHALRSVLYNTKKRLKEAGLPDVEYICRKKGFYYWTDEIPVIEDVQQFEAFYKAAEKTENAEKKLEYLLSACKLYGGEFLPQQAGMVWIAQEGRRYQSMFFSCAEEAAGLLRIQEDWPHMRELGLHASKVNPFADWEVVTMEALVHMGQMTTARRLFDETVDFYAREQGIRPSRRLHDMIGTQINRQYAVLDVIQSELSEKKGEGGGYLCSYPVFQGIYQMVERTMERSGQSVYLMLCSLVDSKGNPMEKGAMMDELSPRMEEAICLSVRHGDIVSRYSKGQYVVLLMNTNRENCSIVQKRINSRFMVGRQRTGIQYYINSVFCPTDS